MPGADFGDHGEGYIRFCFARDCAELAGALESLGQYLLERGKGAKGPEGLKRVRVQGCDGARVLKCCNQRPSPGAATSSLLPCPPAP